MVSSIKLLTNYVLQKLRMDEFELIQHYFTSRTLKRSDVIIGSGDDCAIVTVPTPQQLAISIDTLIAGVHFPINTAAYDIGYKALAVNLSDLAAVGAEPTWVTMSLSLVDADMEWLENFTQGFFDLAKQFNVQLIGGDLTRGSELSITLQVHGFVPPHKALLRSGAQGGDAIYVTGSLGDAGLALQLINQNKEISEPLLNRLNKPKPRVIEGMALRDIANSAIDISDGLLADLGHILKDSGVGASINLSEIPLSHYLIDLNDFNQAIKFALTAGDDYELCFTVSTVNEKKLVQVMNDVGCEVYKIGIIEKQLGLRILNNDGSEFKLIESGYKHF